MPWPQNDTNGSPLTKALGPIAAKLAGNIQPAQLAQALGPLAAQFANGQIQPGQLANALKPLAAKLGGTEPLQLAQAAFDNIQKNPDGLLAKAFKGLVGKKVDQTKQTSCAANGSCPVKSTATWAPAGAQNRALGVPVPQSQNRALGVPLPQSQKEQWANGIPQKVAQNALRSARQTWQDDVPLAQQARQTWQNNVPIAQQARQTWQNNVPIAQQARQTWQNARDYVPIAQQARQTWQDARDYVPIAQQARQTWDDRPRPCVPDTPDSYSGGGCPLKQRAAQVAEQSPCALRAARNKMQSAMQSPCAARAAARDRSEQRECGIQSAWNNRQSALTRSGSICGQWSAANQTNLPATKALAEGVYSRDCASEDYNQVEWIPKTYSYAQPAPGPQCGLGSYSACQQQEVDFNPRTYAALF